MYNWRHHDYEIKAYYPHNQGGGLAIHTWHIGKGSAQTELEVFADRMRRGEISHVELIDCNRYTTTTLYLPDLQDTRAILWPTADVS